MVLEENDRAGRRLVGLQDIHLQQKWAVYFLNFTYNFEKKHKIERVLSCYGKIVPFEVEQLGCVSLGKRIWIRIEFKKQNVFFKRNNESEKKFLPRIPYIAKAARLCADQMFHRKFNDKNCTRKETLDIQNQKLTLLDGKTVPYFR